MRRLVILILLAAVAGVVAGAQPPREAQAGPTGKMYWTDSGTDKIQRANLDGSVVEDLVTGLGAPQGIALNMDGGKMYWTDATKIQRANLDGSNVENLVTTGLNFAGDIELDVAGGKMYWADPGTGKIQRANLDGSTVEDLVTMGVNLTDDIALDVTGGKMYWPSVGSQKIQRANLDGTIIQDLVTGLSFPVAIALDIAGGKMYWTDYGTDKIQRANLDGSAAEDLVTTGVIYPTGIALDIASGKMYWTDSGTDKIQRANLDGSNVEDLVTTGLISPGRIALDLVEVETPAGTSVEAVLGSDVTLTFDNVTEAGTTSLSVSSTGTPPPTGFRLGNPPTYYEISTSAAFTGTVEFCFDYDESAFSTEADLRLFHLEGNWVDVTTFLDTDANRICGTVNNFSEFIAVEPELAVGGLAELPEVAGAPLETTGSSGGAGVLASLAAATAAVLALGGAAWYARRRVR